MRPEHRIHRGRTSRVLAGGVPVALAGSIALALSASPANAADTRSDERMLRALPASPERAGLTLRVVASAIPATYTVRQGDTVSAIATRFGLRTVDVLAINGLGWRSVIHPGDVLRLTGAKPAAAAAPAPAAPAAPSGTYIVQRGDTVSAIASRHGTSIQAVLAANGLGWSSIIYPGNTLVIPGKAPLAAAPASAPAAPKPQAAAPAAPAPAAGGSYKIKAGDTISSIASAHGLSVHAVLAANKLGWSSIIYPGQTIAIPGAPPAAAPAAAPAAGVTSLDGEQLGNAQLIVRVGRELGVPDSGIAIALGTAMQESSMRNLNWGDRDSLGLFQQRPSTGWGTAAEVSDPVRAAKAFYGGASDPNGSRTRGLLDIPGWQGLSFAEAAQAVQISAYPDAYAKWEKSAWAWLAAAG